MSWEICQPFPRAGLIVCGDRSRQLCTQIRYTSSYKCHSSTVAASKIGINTTCPYVKLYVSQAAVRMPLQWKERQLRKWEANLLRFPSCTFSTGSARAFFQPAIPSSRNQLRIYQFQGSNLTRLSNFSVRRHRMIYDAWKIRQFSVTLFFNFLS